MGIVKRLEVEFEWDMVEEFLGHFAMMCEPMEQLVVGLEKPQFYARNIQELFRIFTNIKSATSYFALPMIPKMAQLAESLLDEASVESGPASQEFIAWMLLVSDQFGRWRYELDHDAESLSATDKRLLRLPHIVHNG